MARSGQEVVCEGWLTKSPPTKRIWRARWRRRWFSLRHSGEIPDQYILTYYADRNCRKLKGYINLDDCEQVDLGLKLDERKLKFDHVFDIKTPTRTYYLAADSEGEMKSWVDCICQVCGLKSTSDEEDLQIPKSDPIDIDIVYCEEKDDKSIVPSSNNETPPVSPVSTSPYIPISECITGKTPILTAQVSTSRHFVVMTLTVRGYVICQICQFCGEIHLNRNANESSIKKSNFIFATRGDPLSKFNRFFVKYREIK
jgi:hypothetical protein